MAKNEDGTFDTGGIFKVGGLNTNTQILRDMQKTKEDEVPLDPFSPAATNLPVILTDEDGNRIGNVWSPKKGGLSEAVANVERGNATAIYFDENSQTFANHPISTMTYNNGKINLNVANEVKNTEWYKNLIESDSFKNLAISYANDPTGETKLEISKKGADGKDIKEEKTINDLLWEYKSNLEKASKEYQSYVDTRNNVSRITGGALELTDEDIDILGTYQRFKKDSFLDTDAVLLPKSISRYFENFESYNKEDSSVSAKDFYEGFYNLSSEMPKSVEEAIKSLGGGALAGNDGETLQQATESDKDYAIDLIRLRSNQEMNDIVERLTFYGDDMTPEEKAYYTTEYAKCFAFYHIMTQDTPSSDSWSGFNMAVQGLSLGLGDTFLTSVERGVHFVGDLAYIAVDGTARAASAIDSIFQWIVDLAGNFFTGGWDKMTTQTKNVYEYFDQYYNQIAGEGSFLSGMRKGLDDLGKAIENREDLAASLYESLETDLAMSYANTEAMMRIGAIAGYALNQILITNPVGSFVGNAVSSAITNLTTVAITGQRLSALLNMASFFTNSATTATNVTKALEYIKYINRLKAFGDVVGWSANMLTQGVIDTFLENPAKTDALLFEADDADIIEFQTLIRDNIGWNIAGEFMPTVFRAGKKGLSKVGTAFSKTTPGAITQAVLRKGVNWFTIKGRKAYEGVAEFMTRKSKEFIIEEGSDIPFSGKTNPEKRYQSLRKKIIEVQQQIKDVKLRDGESWSAQAKKIDDLVQQRIDLEEALGTSKRLAVARGKEKIIKNAGLQIEKEELAETTAELTVLSKKIKQTNMPGTFSHETGDYINDLFNKQLLDNKAEFLKANGKQLGKVEQEGLDILSSRISKYEASIPAEYLESYKQVVKNFMEANYRYYYKLNNYLSSDAGGNIITKEKLEGMRANSQYGEAGEMYMPLYAIGGFKGAAELEDFLKDPSRIVREGFTKAQVDAFSRKTFSSDVTYLDPNYTRDVVTNAYAQVANAAEMTDAIVKTGSTTSVPTDSQGNILKTPDAVANAKKKLYTDLENTFEKTFRENKRSLGPKTIEDTKVKAKDYYSKVKRNRQKTINEMLGLDTKGLKTYASTMTADEIAQVGKVYTLPNYSSTIDNIDDLKTLYDSLSPAQKKIIDKNIPGFSKNAVVSGDIELQGKLSTPDDIVLVDAYWKNGKSINDVLDKRFLDQYKIRDVEDFKKFIKEQLEDYNAHDKPSFRDEPENWMPIQEFRENIATYKASRMQELFNSQENIDFLEQIGWRRGYMPVSGVDPDTGRPIDYTAAYSYNKAQKGVKYPAGSLEEDLKLSLEEVLSLPELKSVELHEMSHAAWARASIETRQRIGQDLVNRLGYKIPVDNMIACSRAMNELVAYSTEATYDLKSGIGDLLGSDEIAQGYLDEIASYAGVKNTLSFKDRVANVLDSFLTYVKSKILGINDANTFDDWYNGLINGNFSKELNAGIEEFGYISEEELVGGLNGKSPAKDAIDSWNNAVTNNNLDTLLSRQYIADNKAILNSSYYKEMVGNARAAELEADEALALRTAQAELKAADEGLKENKLAVKKGDELSEQFKQGIAAEKKANTAKTRDFNRLVKNSISDAVDRTAASLLDNPYLEQLIKEYEKAGVSSDLAKEYIIYQWLYDNREANGVLQDIAFRYYNAPSKVSEIKISTDAAKNYSRKFQKAASSIIESRLNKLVKTIQEQGTEGLIDLESTAKRVEEYFKDITDAWGKKEIVEAWDREKGQFKYYKVDRDTYRLVTNYPTFKKNNLFARTMARINSIARIGQITLRGASLVTQGFKDTFDAIVLGGWDELILDNPAGYKKIAQYIGPDVVEAFSKEMTPSAWKQFLADAEWQGLSVEEAIAKSEINNATLMTRIKAGPGTSTSYYSYRNLYENVDEATIGAETQLKASKDTWNGDTKKQWQEAYDKAKVTLYTLGQKSKSAKYKVEDGINVLHNARETFLRKQVYRQNFMDALDAGKSLAQARNYAQYFMENATTNFSRGFAWGSNIVRSIPYFGAMLNGASSMVRLLEVDPLGIMTRFTTDLILPVVGLTVMSLEDPANAELYRNIPEYEKEGNMHWVANGQVFTIPLPEELAKFVLPFRHAVEKMHDANGNAWHELVLNDLLNMPTIPLNSIMMLDDKKINADPSVMDRISTLGMSLFNSMAPNAARTMYIARTGKDPYTGEDYGRQKWYLDENGEYQLMSVSEYGFANDMAEMFKGWGWKVNPVMAEALFSSFFGTGSLDIAEGIRDFAASVQEGTPDIAALISPSMERAGNVLTGTTRTDKQQAQIAWYSLYYDIKDKKNELLSPSGKLAKYAQDIDMVKSQDILNKRVESYNAEVRNWQDSVIERVKQYNEQYGDYFDRSKFAATISMMTAQLSIDDVRNSDQYYNARALAVETMLDAGFDSPNDGSIFGYVYRDPDTNKVSIRYTDPLIISLTENLYWYQGDEAVQMIDDTIKMSGLKDRYNNEIYPEYSKYMNAKDYASANKLAARWDVELMKAIKPIIDEYTVDNLLNKSTAIDLLDNYILVPSTTEAMGRGKYYSSSTGLNKRRGYAQSYIKKIYGALSGKENK